MRMLPNRFTFPTKPMVVKKVRAKVAHVSPPIKGLADDARSAETDAKFASIITNFYVDDDRLSVRAGYRRLATMPGGLPVEHLVPYYGEPERLAAASDNKLFDAETGVLMKGGFSNNDWHWTSFSNLGMPEYTVMANGADGVWSWDGGMTANGSPITVTKIAKNTVAPFYAIVTVSSTTGLQNYDAVIISGADSGHANANGPQRIDKVGDTVNTFQLIGVDTQGWGGDQTTGTMTATEQGSFVKEALHSPPGNLWLAPDEISIVVAHQNRLFFADEAHLCVYYLPLQQKYGELKLLPLNAIFKKGGTIKAMATWTVDGGMGMDDQLVICSSNGEIAIYSGIDPADDFTLVGVYRFDPVMSKWSTMNYGGELYLLLPTGLTAMSTVIKSGREGVEASDKNVVSRFRSLSINHRHNPGWELFLNPNSGRVFCNVPKGGGVYDQMIRGFAKPVWSEFKDIPARCWGWLQPYVYFGDDFGNTYQMHPQWQSDQPVIGGSAQIMPIETDVLMAWNQFKTPGLKHFKMILPYFITDGSPKPAIDVKVDFDQSPPINVPGITEASPTEATWDLATWALPEGAPAQPERPDSLPVPQPATPAVGPMDGDYWVSGSRSWANWTGVGSLGRVGAIRMRTRVINCSFAVTGWDVLYEEGSVFG